MIKYLKMPFSVINITNIKCAIQPKKVPYKIKVQINIIKKTVASKSLSLYKFVINIENFKSKNKNL